MSKLNRNTENQEHASHLPEHGPIDENGKEVLLSLKNVDITFGKGDNAVRAVKNATFDIHKGETFSLVGESGSGKTTIGRAVIRVNALANEGLYNFHLYENEADRVRKVEEMINEVGLLPEHLTRYPHEFSGGQRQRIGLARAMVMEPELVVADEPISALDVSIRAQVLNLLKKFQREKDLTYLFIAHDLSIVRFISDRIAVIYKGDIVEIADAEELFNFPLHPYTHSLISAIPIPDPQLEKNKVLFTYDPSIHDYSTDKPELVCIGHDHWVFGNKKEIEEYKATREKNVPLKTITILDKDAPRPEEHHDNVAHDEIQLPPLHDTGSAWYALLSFLLPVIGIIAAMIFKKHRHYRNYKMCKKGAIAGFIVLAVILALFLLALAAVFI